MDTGAQSADDNLLAVLARYLPSQRVEHSVNVATAARELALRFCPELADKAWTAGLLHDNAKYMDPQELLEHASELGLQVSPEESASPGLLHGKVGAALLGERFGIQDVEISRAVADHVTGCPGMGQLSLVLYVADQTAADRDFPGVDDLREAAQSDLQRAAAMVSRFKLMYILATGKPIILATVSVYNELQSRLRPVDE